MQTPSSSQKKSAMRSAMVLAVAGFLGVIGGFLAGATYGGNYAPNAFFGGVRGYEATGLLGALTGGLVCVLAVLLVSRRPGAFGR